MKIVVFGATGGVGQHVVRLAHNAGHEVTAFVRTPEKLNATEGVSIVQGDALRADDVVGAIAGHDAVISCLASSRGLRRSTEVSRMVANIAQGMQAANVDRIAYCASLGVDNELTGFVGRAIGWVLRHPLAEHRAALAVLTAADRDLTVARPTSLSHAPFVADYVETFTGAPSVSGAIPRASVADFLVKSLEQPEVYSGTSVGLALPRQ